VLLWQPKLTISFGNLVQSSSICLAANVVTRRFQRVSCHQLNGFLNHQRQNNTNLEIVHADGKAFKGFIGKWAMHDAEIYAYDNYGKALFHILTGTPFQNTNIPPGYTYNPWNIEEIMSKIDSGEVLRFDGDWS